MTITTEISKLQENLANSYSTIEEKGATLPSAQNFDNLANAISSIPSATSYTAGTGIDITNDVISVTSDISTGATLGATAVQLADLASVATSGSYNDLSNKPDLNGKANIDLSNITSEGKNIANWSTNVTNCITEIPQDIKLELNNGTLTLKAGSTYYKCDGSFTKVTTSQDYSKTNVSNGYRLVFFTGNGFDIPLVQDCNSGTSEPTTGSKWFNTSNYILYSGGSGNWQQKTNYSLPLAIITVSDGTITSIDQVFNGFGYIGSTVFALPGVKGLIPNGRNTDGTLRNIEFVNDRVKTFTSSYPETAILNLYDGTIDITTYTLSHFFIQNNAPTNYQFMLWLDTLNNEFKYTENTGNSWVKINLFNVATLITTDAGKITTLTPKTVFHASDYNDVVLKQDLATIPHIVETYVNGTSWYRVYSDGWCEQGANNKTSDTNGGYTVTFLKPFKNTNYNVTGMTVDCAGGTQCVKYTRKSAASISFWTINNTIYSSMQFNWQACGYIS